MARQLKTPLLLIAVGSAIAAGSWLYLRVTGEVLAFGPVRPLFVAGPLVLAGVILAVHRVFWPTE